MRHDKRNESLVYFIIYDYNIYIYVFLISFISMHEIAVGKLSAAQNPRGRLQ